jgi:hypothetical protein
MIKLFKKEFDKNNNIKVPNEKCRKCRFAQRPKIHFPCNKCIEDKYVVPITCCECRCYPCTNKKGIRTCKNFEWD